MATGPDLLDRSPKGVGRTRASWATGLAGVVAVGVTLALLELAAGLLAGVPSLVSSVGEFFIPYTPEWLKDWAIEQFGTSDKGVLVAGVVGVSLLLGGLLGRAAERNPALPPAVFLGVAVFGMVAATMTAGTALLPTTLAVVVAAVAGLVALTQLVARAPRTDAGDETPHPSVDGAPDHTPHHTADDTADDGTRGASSGPDDGALGRRGFLAASGAVAVGAGLVGAGGRDLLRRRAAEVAQRNASVMIPTPGDLAAPVTAANRFEVPGLTPVVVPNGEFYRIDTALQVPLVDPTTWQLRIHGMVDREVVLTYEDLVERDLVERYVTLSCVSNEVGDDLVGNASWWGTLLAPLLEEAGVQPGATQVVGRSVDGWTAGFPTEAALDGRDALLAVGMNGEPLPAEHGYPARLVVPGLYGYVSATKWISEIELTTLEGFDAYWVPRGWAKLGPVKTQSRIDVPRPGSTIEPGSTVVAGVAWAPGRGISAVEVSIDDGDWQPAELTEPLSEDAWLQWRAEVELEEGSHTVAVRATDGDGQVQTAELAPVRPDGATGHHTIRVTA